MKVPPPLDVHAHVSPNIDSREIRALGAHVFAMTRSTAEYVQVKDRKDIRTVWAAGAHPGLVRVNRAFDKSEFQRVTENAPVLGEVGLDGSSRVPMQDQARVFRSVLELTQDHPRILSIHSTGAHFQVLRELHRTPVDGAILHWWKGSQELTEEAVRLGCYFSMPPAMMSSREVLALIPVERILPETDHPSGDRLTRGVKHPGGVSEVETRLARNYQLSEQEMRIQFWRNLRALVKKVGVLPLLGSEWRAVFDHLD